MHLTLCLYYAVQTSLDGEDNSEIGSEIPDVSTENLMTSRSFTSDQLLTSATASKKRKAGEYQMQVLCFYQDFKISFL